MLPAELRQDLEAVLGAVADVRELSGGCISRATCVTTTEGERAFLKWGDRHEPHGIFTSEALSLQAIEATRTVRVPRIIKVSEATGDHKWLLLEWLEPGAISPAAWDALARSLAALHAVRHPLFGWPLPNFIGSLHQSNAQTVDWPSFWRDQRIVPQRALAVEGGKLDARDARRIDALMDSIPELAAAGNADGPSLLHGDLWNGNVHGVSGGSSALIDPSSYYGHREVDLAMAALFGGFPRRFFEAYGEVWPLLEGHERRRMLYQLYYLLVHVNLFGGSYVPETMSLVERLGF